MATDFNQVGWFEIPTADLQRATDFYQNVFDVTLEQHDMGPLKMAWFPVKENAMGAPGSLVKADEYTPSTDGTLVYFSVTDIEGTCKQAANNGGSVLREKMSIGEYGFIGLLLDTEGNRIGLHSRS